MSHSNPRTRLAQTISAPTSAQATRLTSACYEPRSLTASLQGIPAGETPMQYYSRKVQPFEQVPLGIKTQRKDMHAHVQQLMRTIDGGGSER